MQGTVTRIWGLTGQRPRAILQREYEWTYLYGSVEPLTGRCHACRLPEVNTQVMNLYLENFSRHLSRHEHALMVLDRAAWHRAGALVIPDNVTLLCLPPYSPELNPVEWIWGNGRRNYLANTAWETIEELEQAVDAMWLRQTSNPESMKSLCGFEWILSALN
jgi:hypothetical protein